MSLWAGKVHKLVPWQSLLFRKAAGAWRTDKDREGHQKWAFRFDSDL